MIEIIKSVAVLKVAVGSAYLLGLLIHQLNKFLFCSGNRLTQHYTKIIVGTHHKTIQKISDGYRTPFCKITLSCETEGVEFISKVLVEDAKDYNDAEFTLSQTYKISVYATKDGYENSDVVTREIVIGNGQSMLFGDLNKDGKVNVADHVKLSEIILNK